MTSSTHCNHGESNGYVAVVDGPAINLTPLGKFLMPPPMFEKQISIPFVPKSIALAGHEGVAYIDKTKTLYSFNCEQGQDSLKSFDLTQTLQSKTVEGTVTQVLLHGKNQALL